MGIATPQWEWDLCADFTHPHPHLPHTTPTTWEPQTVRTVPHLLQTDPYLPTATLLQLGRHGWVGPTPCLLHLVIQVGDISS